MIGGIDYIYECDSDMALDMLLRVVRGVWPNPVIESCDGETKIFRDLESRGRIREVGILEQGDDSYILAIVDPGEFTLVSAGYKRGGVELIVRAFEGLLRDRLSVERSANYVGTTI